MHIYGLIFEMGMLGQVTGEVQEKEGAGRNEEEGSGGIDGPTWSVGACTSRGATQASLCLFIYFMYFITNSLYYLGF